MRRWLALALVLLVVPVWAFATGSLTIPTTIFTQPGGTNVAPLLDQNYQAIASYINTREVSFGLLSARPVAGVSGRLYFASDVNGGALYGDNGTSWSQLSGAVNANIAQQLTGLGLANNGTATATFTIAVGAATSDDAVVANRALMSLTGGLTKKLTAWAVGTNAGCLDAGAVANFTWYSVFLIERLDTGVVDVVCSTSATAPVLPTNYTKKRRIGSVRTDWTSTGSLYFFKQVGNRFRWATVNQDISNATPGINANVATVSTPNGVQTEALLIGVTANTNKVYISETDTNDEAAENLGVSNGGTADGVIGVMTDTAQQIRYRATVNLSVLINTYGWIDRRGQE
jgi:hypothetical protein